MQHPVAEQEQTQAEAPFRYFTCNRSMRWCVFLGVNNSVSSEISSQKVLSFKNYDSSSSAVFPAEAVPSRHHTSTLTASEVAPFLSTHTIPGM